MLMAIAVANAPGRAVAALGVTAVREQDQINVSINETFLRWSKPKAASGSDLGCGGRNPVSEQRGSDEASSDKSNCQRDESESSEPAFAKEENRQRQEKDGHG